MGAAWCRHRAERAHDSKSPLDRVIVRCVDKFYSVDPNATPVRLTRPTPGGVSTVCGNESITEELLLNSGRRDNSTPVRPIGSAGAWQKASLQVPRAEEPLMAKSAPAATADAIPLARTPVPPPRRKRAAAPRRPAETPTAAATTGSRPPPPPRPQDSPSAPPASAHLLSPPKPRPAHTSTVSLPEWRDLERSDDDDDDSKQPPRPSSTSPRPQYLRPPSVTSVSEATLERVETYLRRCRSFGNMSSSGLVDKLSSIDADSDEDEDPWEGVDDFDHAFHPHRGSPPHTPRSRVDRRRGTERQNSDPTTSSVGQRKRRSGATAAAPISTSTPVANVPIVDTLPGFTPPTTEEITRGRFFICTAEEEWFTRDYHRETESVTAPETAIVATPGKEPEQEISEVKKELQSIIYDYNRTKKISTTSIGEVLPTQPVRMPKKKKISVASITPPPSPVSSDLEDDERPNIPPTAIINGEENGDANTHSTLLRLLRECQNIEGALEDITNEDSEMPHVHSALRQLTQNNHHLKENMESAKLVTQSLDSGLDVRGTLDRGTQEASDETSTGAPSAVKNVDSGVDEDDPQAVRHPKPSDTPAAMIGVAEEVPKDAIVRRRRREVGAEDDAGSSSGRSSMTPSLSELEAALSDMLEKSAAAGDDDRASPVPLEQTVIAAPAVPTPVPEDPAADKAVAEPSSPTTMLIPRISVTSDISPSVH